MNLKKLSPSMLLTLGLACTDGKGSDETTTTVNACLSPPQETSETMGPCLDIDPTTFPTTTGSGTESSGADSTVGPCLGQEPPETTGTDTGSGTGTGSDTGTDTDTDGTTGMMADERPPTRAAALERVLERGTLPPDVAARLRDPETASAARPKG